MPTHGRKMYYAFSQAERASKTKAFPEVAYNLLQSPETGLIWMIDHEMSFKPNETYHVTDPGINRTRSAGLGTILAIQIFISPPVVLLSFISRFAHVR